MSQIWRVMRTFKFEKLFQLKKFLLKDFPQFLSIPDTKRDPGNMSKEWRRFHKDSWVFNRVTIPFPNSHFAISSSAGIVNYSMSSHEKKFAQTFTLIFPAPAGQCWPLISKCFPQGRIDLHQRKVSHKVLRQKLIFCRILEIWREDFFPQLSFSFLGED